ncbi:MAG TPA: hypothetical protein DEG76_01305 [Pseudohongiella sp.]|nr:hypothetical protein [Pseudohongiella sp.]|tara:strand:- start:147 stop:584 length:438 start_codon:yes stop_codon:yes gene_type:complete
MITLHYKKAAPKDMDWAYQLFRTVMRQYIADTWGWDELFQRHSFEENIPASSFTMISHNDQDIGGYSLKSEADHLRLEMLLIHPDWQRNGVGTAVMERLFSASRQQQKTLRLNVLKANPAYNFYLKLGLAIESEDRYRYRMLYAP